MDPHADPHDDSLHALLHDARPPATLPPGFGAAVWQRLRRAESSAVPAAPTSWLEGLLERWLQPRLAMAGLAVLMLAGGLTGLASGSSAARQLALQRYLSAVSPNPLR